jgi:hypothetical protein
MRSVAFGAAPNHMTADREPSSSSSASDSPGDDEVDETHETPGAGVNPVCTPAGRESDQFLNGLPRITSVGHPSAPRVTKQKLFPLT